MAQPEKREEITWREPGAKGCFVLKTGRTTVNRVRRVLADGSHIGPESGAAVNIDPGPRGPVRCADSTVAAVSDDPDAPRLRGPPVGISYRPVFSDFTHLKGKMYPTGLFSFSDTFSSRMWSCSALTGNLTSSGKDRRHLGQTGTWTPFRRVGATLRRCRKETLRCSVQVARK